MPHIEEELFDDLTRFAVETLAESFPRYLEALAELAHDRRAAPDQSGGEEGDADHREQRAGDVEPDHAGYSHDQNPEHSQSASGERESPHFGGVRDVAADVDIAADRDVFELRLQVSQRL